MLTFAFLLWLGDTRQIKLEEVNQPSTKHRVLGRAEIFGASHNKLFHWSTEGDLIRVIELQEDQVLLTYFYDGTYYWICGSGKSPFSIIYDKNGKPLDELIGEDKVYRSFLPLEDELFAVTNLSSKRLYQNPHIYQLQKVDFFYEGGRLFHRTYDNFAKIRKKQRDFGFSFKEVFLAKRGRSYLAMNQLEPYVMVYNSDTITKERRDGTQVPTKVEEIKLDLSEYVPPPENFFRVTRPMPRKKVLEIRRKWFFSWSRISSFQNFRDGFLITYGIPKCEGGECGYLTGIQVLNTDLTNSGALMKQRGNFLGVYDDEIFVLPKPKPEQGGLVVSVIRP
ncbi:MAG: hypothetical protein QNK37_22765 [Acidobacteriota bacterium]|nr:hypothetical protein [Acidobacteriota bacterium]